MSQAETLKDAGESLDESIEAETKLEADAVKDVHGVVQFKRNEERKKLLKDVDKTIEKHKKGPGVIGVFTGKTQAVDYVMKRLGENNLATYKLLNAKEGQIKHKFENVTLSDKERTKLVEIMQGITSVKEGMQSVGAAHSAEDGTMIELYKLRDDIDGQAPIEECAKTAKRLAAQVKELDSRLKKSIGDLFKKLRKLNTQLQKLPVYDAARTLKLHK